MRDFILGAALVSLMYWIPKGIGETSLKVPLLDTVRIISKNPQEIKDVVVLISSPKGWTEEDHKIAYDIADHETLVIGVDADKFHSTVCEADIKDDQGSTHKTNDLLAVSNYVEQTLGLKKYITPTLIALDGSSQIAKNTALLSHEGQFKTINYIGSCDSKNEKRLSCEAQQVFQSKINLYIDNRSECQVSQFKIGTTQNVFLKKHADINLGVKKIKFWPTELRKQWELHNDTDSRAPASVMSIQESSDLKNLPIVELIPKELSKKELVILLSGDGGWAEFTQDLAAEYSQRGYPVVGINSLFYFWNKKEPVIGAKDLSSIMDVYQKKLKTTGVILVGFSFGSEVLPFFVNAMDPNSRKAVSQISMLAPGENAKFEFELKDWFNNSDVGVPIVNEVKKLNGIKINCLYADHDRKSVCAGFDKNKGAGKIGTFKLKGDHHFDNDFSQFDHILW